jgi:hypothetical protein
VSIPEVLCSLTDASARKTSGPSCVTSRPSDSVRMITSLKSERLKTPNEGSKPEFHLRWIRVLVTRISSALDFLTTSRLVEIHRRKAPDSSRGSAPATFTPKRLATRATGQAGTQRAAEHGSITPYPTTPAALDHCRVLLQFLPLRFESD